MESDHTFNFCVIPTSHKCMKQTKNAGCWLGKILCHYMQMEQYVFYRVPSSAVSITNI